MTFYRSLSRDVGANTLVYSQAICPMPTGINTILRIGQIARSTGRICPYVTIII